MMLANLRTQADNEARKSVQDIVRRDIINDLVAGELVGLARNEVSSKPEEIVAMSPVPWIGYPPDFENSRLEMPLARFVDIRVVAATLIDEEQTDDQDARSARATPRSKPGPTSYRVEILEAIAWCSDNVKGHWAAGSTLASRTAQYKKYLGKKYPKVAKAPRGISEKTFEKYEAMYKKGRDNDLL